MCHPTRCKVCGKTTWAGCGNHVDAVRAQVPAHQWCTGHDDSTTDNKPRRLFGRGKGARA